MDSSKIPSFRISKTETAKEMISDCNGDWIKRFDYEQLLWELNSYKEELTIENLMLNLTRFINKQNLNANITLALQVLSLSLTASIQSIIEKAIKDKQIELNDKGEEPQKV